MGYNTRSKANMIAGAHALMAAAKGVKGAYDSAKRIVKVLPDSQKRNVKHRFQKIAEARRSAETQTKGDQESKGVVREIQSSTTMKRGRTEIGSKISKITAHKRRRRRRRRRQKKVDFTHGHRTTIELFNVNTWGPGITGSVSTSGFNDIPVNQAGHRGIYILHASQMEVDFKIGENQSGSWESGILDPPPTTVYSAGLLSAYTHNFIKKLEGIFIDKLMLRIYIADTKMAKFRLQIQEWVCNESCDIGFYKRAYQCYQMQPHTIDNGTTANQKTEGYVGYSGLGLANEEALFSTPTFDVSKIPGFKKYWKRGLFSKMTVVEPGQELDIKVPYRKIFWNRAKFFKEPGLAATAVDTNMYEYQKGITRFFEIKTVGLIGRAEANTNYTALSRHGYNIGYQRTLTAHRSDMWGLPKYQYYTKVSSVQEKIPENNSLVNAGVEYTLPTTVTDNVVYIGPDKEIQAMYTVTGVDATAL